MASDTTRLSVEISKTDHRKLKTLANANGLTIKELVLTALSPVLHPNEKHNKTTLKALNDTDSGIGIKTYKNVDELWNALGLD